MILPFRRYYASIKKVIVCATTTHIVFMLQKYNSNIQLSRVFSDYFYLFLIF